MPKSCEYHCNSVLVTCVNYFLISYRASRLDYCRNARLSSLIDTWRHTISEKIEKKIRFSGGWIIATPQPWRWELS